MVPLSNVLYTRPAMLRRLASSTPCHAETSLQDDVSVTSVSRRRDATVEREAQRCGRGAQVGLPICCHPGCSMAVYDGTVTEKRNSKEIRHPAWGSGERHFCLEEGILARAEPIASPATWLRLQARREATIPQPIIASRTWCDATSTISLYIRHRIEQPNEYLSPFSPEQLI